MVHPASGDIYIVTKAGGRSETAVYKARAGGDGAMLRVATLDFPAQLYRIVAGGITGGGISPNGRRVVLSYYFQAYEAVLPAGKPFDDIWKQPFETIPLGAGFQAEGVAYDADGKTVLATSEGNPCPLIEVGGS
jgi:hypothetical protein